jgi:predicted RNase H-like nuclease (RuvC/YqgF family)
MTEQFTETENSAIQELTNKLKIAFSQFNSQVNLELEDHLDTINQNTDEIQVNYQYMCELDRKITKLNEKIDDIHMNLSKLTGKKIRKLKQFEDIDPLTTKEKNIFLNLYTEEEPVSYSHLARKMSMPVQLLRQYISNLIEKGIPIQKLYKNTLPYIQLDRRFKNLQAKTNILKIEQKILV